MKNYAEEIAYLYFRLNGFFLLDNYVTHAGENNIRYHADSDLLGIKTNMVREDVGLKEPEDIDLPLQNLFGTYKYIGLICEVKGGRIGNLNNTVDRLSPCIKRLGLLEDIEIADAVAELKIKNCYNNSNTIILKILATKSRARPALRKLWFNITINQMLTFIESRANKYEEKGHGWNFYSSNLFQYLLKRNLPQP